MGIKPALYISMNYKIRFSTGEPCITQLHDELFVGLYKFMSI